MAYPKGVVSPELAARLLAAVEDYDRARAERDQAIAEALHQGGSIKVVSELTGLSPSRIRQIGHDHGWPTKERMAELRAANDPPDITKEILRHLEEDGGPLTRAKLREMEDRVRKKQGR